MGECERQVFPGFGFLCMTPADRGELGCRGEDRGRPSHEKKGELEVEEGLPRRALTGEVSM